MLLINMLSCHCYYVYPRQATTLNLACCPDVKNRSSGAKKNRGFSSRQFWEKTAVLVLKTVAVLLFVTLVVIAWHFIVCQKFQKINLAYKRLITDNENVSMTKVSISFVLCRFGCVKLLLLLWKLHCCY